MPRHLVHRVLQENRDLSPSLSQRWHLNREGTEPIVQIFPQFSFRECLVDVGAGRRQDTNVNRSGLVAARTKQHFILQNLHDSGLQGHWHFGDFVEENRALLGAFDFSETGPATVHDASLIAEQFVFEKVRRHVRAVHFEELEPGANRQLVDQSGNGILAAPTLPEDKHRNIRLRQ